jgi:uncharacterized RDD family membrane protein YckC
VHGNAVCVFGAMHLGPHAHIDGNVVCAPGVEHSEEGAFIGGQVVKGGDMGDNSEAIEWWNRGILRGRPLFFGHGIHFIWLVTLFSVGLSVLLALMFPRGVQKCGDELATRPGITILTGFMGMVGIPVLFLLLFVTFVGIPVAIFVLPLAALITMIFGRTAVFALVGNAIVRKPEHPAVAVLVGAGVIVLFMMVPVLGLMLMALVDFLGFSCALAALFAQRRASAAPPATPAAPASPSPVAPSPVAPSPAAPVPAAAVPDPGVPAAPEALAGGGAENAQPLAPVPLLVPPAAAVSAPPPLAQASETALPRAGFWIRILAIFIDCILVGIVTRMHDLFPLVLAAYCMVLWKLRGATIGDIILGLKVVRTDGAPIDWVTALVRALACFFSVVVVGLGFIWIAFDREKQGWHDKIAGTIVVRVPKGMSLV